MGIGHWQRSVLTILDAADHLPGQRPHTIDSLLKVEGRPKNWRQRANRLSSLATLLERDYIEEYNAVSPGGRKYRAVRLGEKGAGFLGQTRNAVRWSNRASTPLPDEPPPEPIVGQLSIYDGD